MGAFVEYMSVGGGHMSSQVYNFVYVCVTVGAILTAMAYLIFTIALKSVIERLSANASSIGKEWGFLITFIFIELVGMLIVGDKITKLQMTYFTLLAVTYIIAYYLVRKETKKIICSNERFKTRLIHKLCNGITIVFFIALNGLIAFWVVFEIESFENITYSMQQFDHLDIIKLIFYFGLICLISGYIFCLNKFGYFKEYIVYGDKLVHNSNKIRCYIITRNTNESIIKLIGYYNKLGYKECDEKKILCINNNIIHKVEEISGTKQNKKIDIKKLISNNSFTFIGLFIIIGSIIIFRKFLENGLVICLLSTIFWSSLLIDDNLNKDWNKNGTT